MHSSQDYPFDYGFVPQSHWEDGDPLDVVVLTTYPLAPGILVKVRPVGVMNMIDDGDSDAKIIAVPQKDPRFDEIHDLADVNKHTLKEIEHFFATYKKIQNKEVIINGFSDAAAAKEAIVHSQKLYAQKFLGEE
jgi:inorganic pyrophosphatase